MKKVLIAAVLCAGLTVSAGTSWANGKPGDGSVGRANHRNERHQPKGDKNKGYECDDNKGVGQGNPAHSGCTTTTAAKPSTTSTAPTTSSTPTTAARPKSTTTSIPQAPVAHVRPPLPGQTPHFTG